MRGTCLAASRLSPFHNTCFSLNLQTGTCQISNRSGPKAFFHSMKIAENKYERIIKFKACLHDSLETTKEIRVLSEHMYAQSVQS